MLLLSISTCVAIPRRHTARPIAASRGPDGALRWRRPPRLPRPNRPRERRGPNPLPGARNSSGTTRHFGPPRTRNAVAAKARPMGKPMLDLGRPRALRHWRAPDDCVTVYFSRTRRRLGMVDFLEIAAAGEAWSATAPTASTSSSAYRGQSMFPRTPPRRTRRSRRASDGDAR
jgi:hypothetical protein